MQQCSICLDDLDASVTSASFSVGDRVLALWGHKWFPGDVYAVKDGGSAYEIAWDDEDSSNEIPASRVRAAPVTVDVDAPTARDARPPAVVTPRVAPPVAPPAPPPEPTPHTSDPPPAPRAIVPRETPVRPSVRALPANTNTYRCPASCGCGLPHRRCGGCAPCRAKHGDACLAPRPVARAPPPAPAPLPPATRSHVASTASAWVVVCTDLLEAAKDCTNLQGLRTQLTSRVFRCGSDHPSDGGFNVHVPPEFPCYYDVVGKDYATNQNSITNMTTLRKYLDGALALARAGDAYRTDAEYKDARASASVSAKTSRFTGVRRDKGRWRATIRVGGSEVQLGAFDDEEDAARAYDAAVVKYKNAPTVNFPGEAPLAAVLAALPDAPPPPPPPPAPLSRSARTRTPKVIVDPEAPARRRKRGTGTSQGAKKRKTKSREEKRAGGPRRSGRAPAPKVIVDAPGPVLRCERDLPIQPRNNIPKQKSVEGAVQKSNGKWINTYMFPGRDFDDLEEYRAAKKQRVAQKYR